MAGKRRQNLKKSKKKSLKKKSKKIQPKDPKQKTLPFVAQQGEHGSIEIGKNRSSFEEKKTVSIGPSTSRKRSNPDNIQAGPSAKRHAENSCLNYMAEEEEISFEEPASEQAMSPDSDYYEEAEKEWLEEAEGCDDLENIHFTRYKEELEKALEYDAATKPPELDDKMCKGVGDPSEIWNLMCKKDEMERIRLNWLKMAIQPHIRAVLVDWMMEVCEQEKQHRSTFHLAVNYMDRFLSLKQKQHEPANVPAIPVVDLQCVGTVCLFLASKYEEIYPPKMEVLVENTDGACTREQVEVMEKIVLHYLNWGLNVTTSVQWLATFFQLMGSKKLETEQDGHYNEKPTLLPKYLREQFMNMAKVLDICILDSDHLKFSYRELAAAVLFLGIEPYSYVERITGYSYEQIQPAIDWVTACNKYALEKQAVGDPLPTVPDINPEEWHDIQTHGPITPDEAYTKVCEERIKMERKRLEEKKAIRSCQVKRPPRNLLPITNKPTAI